MEALLEAARQASLSPEPDCLAPSAKRTCWEDSRWDDTRWGGAAALAADQPLPLLGAQLASRLLGSLGGGRSGSDASATSIGAVWAGLGELPSPASTAAASPGGKRKRGGAAEALPLLADTELRQAFKLYCQLWAVKQQSAGGGASQLPDPVLAVFAEQLVRRYWLAVGGSAGVQAQP